MIPAFITYFLWPRRRRESTRSAATLECHRISPISSSSSDEAAPRKAPKKQKAFNTLLSKRPLRQSKKEPQPVQKSLVCYLCGHHIESSRLLDHIDDCLLAWIRREEMKPVDERVPLPTPPDELDQKLPESAEAIEQFNKQMRSAWLKAINIRCKYCHTTLKAGAYFRHIKTCQPPTPDHKDQSLKKKSTDIERGHAVQKIMKEKASATAPETPKEIKTKRNPAPHRPRRLKSLEDCSLKAMTSVTVLAADEPQAGQTASASAPARRKPPVKTASVRQPKSASKKAPAALRRSASNASEHSARRELKSDRSHREQLTELRESVEELKVRQDSRRVIKKSKSERKPLQHPPSHSSELSSISEKSSSLPRKENLSQPTHEACCASDSAIPKKGANSKDRKLVKSMTCVAKGPKGYTCYLCGRQFGKASFHIHHRQCQQLWKDREALKTRKRDRRPLPTPPPEIHAPLPTDRDEIQNFNDIMMACYEAKALISCPHCFRTFSQEAYEKHQRICSAETPGGPLGPSKHRHHNIGSTTGTAAAKPKEEEHASWPIQYCCYLCGRQYGSQSLFLHIPRCQALWESREARKLKKQERRPLPPPPPELKGFPDVSLPTDPEQVLEFNNAMYDYWNSVSLTVCSKCGRSFNEESFEKHQRLCTGRQASGGKMALQRKHSYENERGSSSDADTSESCEAGEELVVPKRYTCYLCSKQYGSKSLLIHIPHCEKRWVANEENKLVGQRRALPTRPKELQNQPLPSNPASVAAFNQAMTDYWTRHTATLGDEWQ